jgi:hypothetical protein
MASSPAGQSQHGEAPILEPAQCLLQADSVGRGHPGGAGDLREELAVNQNGNRPRALPKRCVAGIGLIVYCSTTSLIAYRSPAATARRMARFQRTIPRRQCPLSIAQTGAG